MVREIVMQIFGNLCWDLIGSRKRCDKDLRHSACRAGRFPEQNCSGLIEAGIVKGVVGNGEIRFPEQNCSGLIEAACGRKISQYFLQISGAELLRPH